MRKSYLWAGLFTIAIGGWLATPYLTPFLEPYLPVAKTEPLPLEEAAEKKAAPFRVRVKTFTAMPRAAQVRARGTTEASKRIEVRARTSGIVENSPFTQGAQVKQGDILCQLDIAGRNAQLAQAKANLASAQRDYEASRKLSKKDFVAESTLMENAAKLDSAKAQLESVEWDIGWTAVTAPSGGVLVDKPAEVGLFLQPGGICATISVLDPMVVAVQVGERAIPYVRAGMMARAELATGETADGRVSFIASAADVATRTFRVELEIANPQRTLREGVTAELIASLPPVQAHKLPSSVLGLDDKGQFGVRMLESGNTTKFMPVTLIAQERDGAWVAGLPAQVTLVTVGQDYVKDGEPIEPVMETAEAMP